MRRDELLLGRRLQHLRTGNVRLALTSQDHQLEEAKIAALQHLKPLEARSEGVKLRVLTR